MARLNKAQTQAVEAIEGPVMVLAGPGTGKTQILAHRVGEILATTDMNPSNILCLTFTDAASVNMTERIAGLIGAAGYDVAVHTFHSFAKMVFGRWSEYFYRGASFQPAGEIEKLEIINDILRGLPHDNPLAGTREEIANHLKSVRSAISAVKRKGALTPAKLGEVCASNLEFIDFAEGIMAETFAAKMSTTDLPLHKKGYERLAKFKDEKNTLAVAVINDFADAINESLESGKTNAVTAFKNQYFNAKLGVMKDRKKTEKTCVLVEVYEKYQTELDQRGLYDFDDMIVQIVDKLESSAELRAELQEQYQYILVDEFQDTNDAQLKVLFSLADAPDSNIMVVGDDDQAIYSFQGANVNNLREFERRYPRCAKVQLYENYRSEAPVLKLAESTISGAEIRIKQGFFENLAKLTSQKIHEDGEKIEFIEAASEVDELAWVAESVAEESRIKSQELREIAVIAREHKDLLALVPYLHSQGLHNIEYEHNLDALGSEPVRALETLARVVCYLGNGAMSKANELMPELLAHPAWGVPARDIFELSLATEYNGRWIETIENVKTKCKNENVKVENKKLTDFAGYLVGMSVKVKNLTLEDALDELFDYKYKEYYFNDDVMRENPQQYVDFLTDLTALREALREFNAEEASLKTFIDYLDLTRKYGQKIPTTRQYGDEAKIYLMSAHGAKGLEFDSIYMIHGTKDRWLKNKSDGFFPSNLHLQTPGGNDENLRLIFVAITRAKHRLFISSTKKRSKKGENLTILPVLGEITTRQIASESSPQEKAEIAWNAKFTEVNKDLREVLAPRLADYKLNATAVNSFTNLEYAGPQAFLLNNLLRFPSAKTPAADYGTAVHNTLQNVITRCNSENVKVESEKVKKTFEEELKKMHMMEVDYNFYLKKGQDLLPKFVEKFESSQSQQTEQVFNAQLGDVRLTGKLDLIEIDEKTKTINVVDFKTGEGFREFNKGKIKTHTYFQQLMFYKVLVENSTNRPGYKLGTATLYFVEDEENGKLEIDFGHYNEAEFAKLISTIWEHIMKLDFPDVSQYKPNLAGTLEFEKSLLEGEK